MAIKYYPNRRQKIFPPVIDTLQSKRVQQKTDGRVNLDAAGMDVVISQNFDWQINSLSFQFSAATPRNYSAKILNGRRIATDLNDYFWIQATGTQAQRITLDQGFYTGTQLCAEIKTQLEANTYFLAKGLTFTVTYSATTGLFTITPSSGQIKYLEQNIPQSNQYRDSIAGHVFGFTATTSFAASLTSDTASWGLGTEAAFIDQTASVVLEHFHDDKHVLSVDQALHLEASMIALVVNYSVVWETVDQK